MLKYKVRFLSVLFAICFVCIISVSAFADAEGKAHAKEHWAQEILQKWSTRGLIKDGGTGFRPEDPISRAEFGVLLNRILRYQKVTEPSFSDLSKEAWYYEDLSKLCSAGILKGYGDGSLRPEGNLKREEAAVLLSKIFAIEASDKNSQNQIKDVDDISPWAKEEMHNLFSKEYLRGDMDGKVYPKRHLKRAEAIALLDRISPVLITKEGTYSEDVDGNLLVSASGVTLKNMKISGNLYIAEGVGEGEVFLENVELNGSLFAKGGGKNSLVLNNCKIKELVALKENLHIVFENGTRVKLLRSDFKDGLIDLSASHIEKIVIVGNPIALKLDAQSSIGTLNSDANGTSVQGEKGAIVKEANLNARTELKGKFVPDSVNIEIAGCKIETAPKKIHVKDGIRADVSGVEIVGTKGAGTENPSSSGSSSSASEEERYLSDDLPDLSGVPFYTAFEDLNLAKRARLSSSEGSVLEVRLTWDEREYKRDKSGRQTLHARVAAIAGTLPSWVPEQVSVEVTVLEAPLPASFNFEEVAEEYTIVKGEAADFKLKIRDKNGSVLNAQELEWAEIDIAHEGIPEGINFVKGKDNIKLAVDKHFARENFTLTLLLSHKGGELRKEFLFKTPDPATEQVSPVRDIALYRKYQNSDEERGARLWIRFTLPSDVSGIDRYDLIFEKEDDPGVYYKVKIPKQAANYVYEMDVTRYFTNHVWYMSNFESGVYKVKVESVASGDGNEALNSTAESEYKIDYAKNKPGTFLLRDSLITELAAFVGFQGNSMRIVFDYHYKNRVLPDDDTFVVDVQCASGAGEPFNASEFAYRMLEKGRLELNYDIDSGAQAGIELGDLQLHLKHYFLNFENKIARLEVSDAEVMGINRLEPDQIPIRDVYSHFVYGVSSSSSVELLKAPLGTSKENLPLPLQVELVLGDPHSTEAQNVRANLTWILDDYDANTTEIQRLIAKVDPILSGEDYPAWIPEYVSLQVQLSQP